MCLLPPQHGQPVCFRPVQALHAATVCEFICLSVLLCLEGLISFMSPISAESYNLSASFSAAFPEAGGEGMEWMKKFHVGLSVPRCFTICTIVQLLVSMFVPINYRGS